MSNSIKYSVSAQTLALKKGNFWIGTGDVGKGPTSTTDYYNGITPPSGGYTIYLNKASGGPSIYCPANDAALISLTNSIAGASYTTAAQCLDYFATQTDKMVFNSDYPAVVTNGLVLNLDAGFTPSYPTTGTTWYDLSGNGNNGTLVNSPTFSSSNNGVIVFDGVDDRIFILNNNSFNVADNITLEMWVKLQVSQSNNLGFLIKYTGNDGYLFYVTNNSDKAFAFDYRNRDGTYYRTIGTTNIQDGVWKCLTVQKSGLYSRVYINSTLEGTTVASTVGDMSSNVDLNLGTDFSTYMNGQMGSFRIYNRALTQAEITQNYNAIKSRYGL